MRPERLLNDLNLSEWLESLLPDFVLAFAFFTSLTYAVLGKRFEQQRPAITMSAAIGFALSIGLVWWERSRGFSIKDLGPIAIGFAVIVLAFVMYQCIRQVGGSWAGAGITIGACILVARIIGIDVPIDSEIIQSVTVAALIIGIMALFFHTRGHSIRVPHQRTDSPKTRRNMSNLFRERHLSEQLGKGLKKLHKKKNTLNEHPEEASNISLQLKRMLPAEGYLTERMSQLRAKAHQIRDGHIARLEETRHAFAKLPTSAKKKAAAELAAQYNKMVGSDSRLERLDKSVAENERRIKELTKKAQDYTARHEHKKLGETLKAAEKLQHHNSKLFKLIEQTENKLSAIAKKVANEVKQIEK
jgi:hypothetical protein